VIADLDTLLTALYVELTDRIIPSLGLARSGPGKPMLICTCDRTVTGFCLANHRLSGERQQARQMLEHQPSRSSI